jgi:hypothetical protein
MVVRRFSASRSPSQLLINGVIVMRQLRQGQMTIRLLGTWGKGGGVVEPRGTKPFSSVMRALLHSMKVARRTQLKSEERKRERSLEHFIE